jgi:hypothetical protein
MPLPPPPNTYTEFDVPGSMQTAFFKKPLSANELSHSRTFKKSVKYSIFVPDIKKKGYVLNSGRA